MNHSNGNYLLSLEPTKGSKPLPDEHAPKRSQDHRVSKHIIEQLGHRKVSSVENHAPHPSVEADERENMPQKE